MQGLVEIGRGSRDSSPIHDLRLGPQFYEISGGGEDVLFHQHFCPIRRASPCAEDVLIAYGTTEFSSYRTCDDVNDLELDFWMHSPSRTP